MKDVSSLLLFQLVCFRRQYREARAENWSDIFDWLVGLVDSGVGGKRERKKEEAFVSKAVQHQEAVAATLTRRPCFLGPSSK